MNIINNSIVLDLNKVQFASFYYRNQYGGVSRTLPRKMTYRGERISPDAIAFGIRPQMRLIEYIILSGKDDNWIPVVRFQLTANHNVKYTGNKAVSLYKAWCEKIFKKKK